jgi:hypothetical protein
MLEQDFFDLARVPVEAACDDHVFSCDRCRLSRRLR